MVDVIKDYFLLWHKIDERAIIPTKRDEDAGFDIYTIEEDVVLMPHEKRLFKTGLQYWIDDYHYLLGFDRGSTGSKGIHLHCGVCDSGYRGELFICLSNDNTYPVIFQKAEKPHYEFDEQEGKIAYFVYPTSKAIAQLMPMLQLSGESREVDDTQWKLINELFSSERQETKLGESGK